MSIRRSSSIAVNRENPRLSSSFLANKSHTQENESFCHDKLESIHFESQEIQAQVENLISKMKNDINLQVTFPDLSRKKLTFFNNRIHLERSQGM